MGSGLDIKQMLANAILAEEQKKATENESDQAYDEFHAIQLAWSIPLLVAGRQLAEELAPYNNMRMEIGDVFVSLTVRLESENTGYANDMEYVVTTHLPDPSDMAKRFICETVGEAEDGSTTLSGSFDALEDALSWLVKQAAKGIKNPA